MIKASRCPKCGEISIPLKKTNEWRGDHEYGCVFSHYSKAYEWLMRYVLPKRKELCCVD